MKIYTVRLDMTYVLGRLKKFQLREFKVQFPILFIEAKDPDDACYFTMCKFSELLLKQKESVETAQLIKTLQNDIRITKVYCKDEQERL